MHLFMIPVCTVELTGTLRELGGMAEDMNIWTQMNYFIFYVVLQKYFEVLMKPAPTCQEEADGHMEMKT